MAEEKNPYEEKYRAKLDEWNAEIDKLAARARQANADARIEYQEQIDNLRRHRDEAEKRLRALRESGDSAWKDLKKGADEAWDEMEKAFKKALTRFR